MAGRCANLLNRKRPVVLVAPPAPASAMGLFPCDADGVHPQMRENRRLQEDLAQLDRMDPTGLPTAPDRMAFWINAYNAFAIQGMLDGYSLVTLWGRSHYCFL